MGLEASWNNELTGITGRQLQRRVAGGQWMPVSDEYIVEPVAGYDIISSIDMHLQDVASNALRRQLQAHDAAWGTVILMEVATGKIRAMANLTRTTESTESTPSAYSESYNHAIGTAVETGINLQACVFIDRNGNRRIESTDEIDTGNGVVAFYGRRCRTPMQIKEGMACCQRKKFSK